MNILLFCLLLTGCSILKNNSEISNETNEPPGWIYSPYEACREEAELCATGEAKSFSDADAQARSNLGSIFEVKIKSELSVQTSASQTFPWQNSVKQEVQQSLSQSVDQVLESVQIKKRFKHRGLTYSLAALDRQKASDIIGSRLKIVDSELEVLWAKRSRTNLRRIVRLYLEREKLNERYSIASGSGKPSIMTFKEIVSWRQSRPVVENLSLRSGQAPDWMKEKLTELLSEAGFKIISSDASKALSLNVDSIKEFLNVSGFEKYTFTMTLTSFKDGEKMKVISASETVTGRSQADALLKVRTFFNEYIEQHLSDLHLD